MSRMMLNIGQVVFVARISQFIEVNDWLIALVYPASNKVAADKTGSAGDEDCHGFSVAVSKMTAGPNGAGWVNHTLI